jgi:hypothetical protein
MEPEGSPRRAKRRTLRGAFEDLTREIERIPFRRTSRPLRCVVISQALGRAISKRQR